MRWFGEVTCVWHDSVSLSFGRNPLLCYWLCCVAHIVNKYPWLILLLLLLWLTFECAISIFARNERCNARSLRPAALSFVCRPFVHLNINEHVKKNAELGETLTHLNENLEHFRLAHSGRTHGDLYIDNYYIASVSPHQVECRVNDERWSDVFSHPDPFIRRCEQRRNGCRICLNCEMELNKFPSSIILLLYALSMY